VHFQPVDKQLDLLQKGAADYLFLLGREIGCWKILADLLLC
jgi:hypothetical protein